MTDKKAIEAMLEQGFSQLREGQYEEAVETFSACHVIENQDDRALRGRGLAYIRLNTALSAMADFKMARDLNKDEPENWMGLAVSLAMQNKVYEAIAVYEQLIELKPQFVTAYVQLGLLHIKVGVIKKGKDYLNKALTLRPSMAQRRMIESMLKEQTKLDMGRYYRPDFDQLRKDQEKQGSLLFKAIEAVWARFKKKDNSSVEMTVGGR